MISQAVHGITNSFTRLSRIDLVAPSNAQCVQSLFVFHEGQGLGSKLPLGLLSIATHLRNQGFHNVEIFDAGPEGLTPEKTAERIIHSNPDVVGFSVMTDYWYWVWKAIEILKQARPSTVVVIGGPHAAIYPELSLKASAADIVVAGDGEFAMSDILTALCENRPPVGIDGVYVKDSSGHIVAPKNGIAVVENLDDLPIPDRKLVDLSRYGALLSGENSTTIVTSRGCPCRCVFCKLHVQRVVTRSASLVVDEFEEISALGITNVEVYDDTFTWDKARVLDICQGLIDRGVRLQWSARSRVNRVDEELLAAMKAAGCNRIHFGIESGNEEILKASRKGISKEQARRAVAMARQVGLEVLTYYMVGFLDETSQDAGDTSQFARELNSDYVAFAVLIPYPGTAIYEEALERGIIPNDFWREFVSEPKPDYVIPHVVENIMTRDELIKFVHQAHFRFYWRIGRVIQELMACRSWVDFRKRAVMGLNLLRHRILKMKTLPTRESNVTRSAEPGEA